MGMDADVNLKMRRMNEVEEEVKIKDMSYFKEKLEEINNCIVENDNLIKAVVNGKTRIPLVEYKKKGNEMIICSKYSFLNENILHVKMEYDKILINFINKNEQMEKEMFEEKNEVNPFLKKTVIPNFSFLQDEKKFFLIILSGTSGSGKSTLSSLLSFFLKIKRIMSTDIIREILRKYEVPNKLLKYSTYESWKIDTDEEISECDDEDKKKEIEEEEEEKVEEEEEEIKKKNLMNNQSKKEETEEERAERCIKNYLKQCDLVFTHIENLIEDFIKKKKSLIIEGVHMNPFIINKLTEKHPNNFISFLIYVKDKEIRKKRFSNRCSTLENIKNKYLDNINYINNIQTYLIKAAHCLTPNIHFIENLNINSSLEIMMEAIRAFTLSL